MKHLARNTLLTIMGAILLAPSASASFRLDIAGPHGRFSIGTDDYIEYGDADTYTDYHAALEGYGHWTYRPEWGEVFVPAVDISWRPYLYGRWIYTDFGLTWVSYEPWGYLPHHYGRWHYLSGMGWCWRPGYRYYGANVGFYYGGDYVGWWPAGCCGGGLNINIDINIFINIVHRRDFMGTGLNGHLVSANRLPLLRAGRLPRAMPVPTRASMERFIGRPIASVKMQQRRLLVGGHAMTMPVPGKQLRSEIVKSARKVAVAGGPKRIGVAQREESPRRALGRGQPNKRNTVAERKGKLDRHLPSIRSHNVAPRKRTAPHRTGKLDRHSPSSRSHKVAPRKRSAPHRTGKLDRHSPSIRSHKVAPRKRTAPHRTGKLDRHSPSSRSHKVAPRKRSAPHRTGKLDRRSPSSRSHKVAPRKRAAPHRSRKLDRRSPSSRSHKVAPRKRTAPHRSGKLDRRSPSSRSHKVAPRKRTAPHRSGKLDRQSPSSRSHKVAPSHRGSREPRKKARPKKGSKKRHQAAKKPVLA